MISLYDETASHREGEPSHHRHCVATALKTNKHVVMGWVVRLVVGLVVGLCVLLCTPHHGMLLMHTLIALALLCTFIACRPETFLIGPRFLILNLFGKPNENQKLFFTGSRFSIGQLSIIDCCCGPRRTSICFHGLMNNIHVKTGWVHMKRETVFGSLRRQAASLSRVKTCKR